MSITPLSAARIAGEVGLAGGTITGGCCAAKYSKGVSKLTDVNKELKEENDELKKKGNETDSNIELVAKAYFALGKYLNGEKSQAIQEISSEFQQAHSCLYNYTQRVRSKECTSQRMQDLTKKLNELGYAVT